MTREQRVVDTARRIQIIFGNDPAYTTCGLTYLAFEYLSPRKIELLMDENLIDLDECQNDSPTVEEFYNFISLPLWHGDMCCNGYVIGDPEREDCRVSLTGLYFDPSFNLEGKVTFEQVVVFLDFARRADEFEVSEKHLYCWWD